MLVTNALWGTQPLPGLVWGFRIHPDGRAEELNADRPLEDGPGGWLWLHFNLADGRACQFLKGLRELAPEAVEVLTAPDHHQQLHAENASIFGAIADLGREIHGISDQQALLHLVMTDRYVISGRRHALNSAEATRRDLRGGRRLESVAALFELIVEHVLKTIDRVAETTALQLDEIEERLVEAETEGARGQLGGFRRTTVRLHRQLADLRTVLHRLERSGVSGLPASLRVDTGALLQQLDGLDHEIIALRERARLLQEEVSQLVAEETNQNLRVLSLVTILFLPPTLMAGFFGMNLKGMLFAESEVGFWAGVATSFASSAAVFLVLRWFGVTRW